MYALLNLGFCLTPDFSKLSSLPFVLKVLSTLKYSKLIYLMILIPKTLALGLRVLMYLHARLAALSATTGLSPLSSLVYTSALVCCLA